MRQAALILLMLLLAGCGQSETGRPGDENGNGDGNAEPAADSPATADAEAGNAAACAPDNGGINLPDEFCAGVFADEIGRVRHIAAAPDGRLYATLREPKDGHGLVALRDGNGDGEAEQVERFGAITGTGALVHDGYLYASSDTAVYRWSLPPEGLAPAGDPELVVGGFPEQDSHAAKSLAIGDGSLFVNVGAPSNACMEESRTKGSPGMDPCPLLEEHGGIWRFDADATDQEHHPDRRYATGIRNAVALAWNPAAEELYIVQHGRDQLHTFFPDLYSTEDNALLPAEEMFRVNEGDDFGWPYCYYDQRKEQKVLMPEYGGDGETVDRCSEVEDPVVAFPGHWAPNGLHFYTGDQFPERYRGGAFVAFHGSWNRAPEPQAGYRVSFVPFDGAEPAGDYETFADGFPGKEPLQAPGEAEYRPMGLAQGPDGELYISDSVKGRVWRVVYRD